MASIIEQLTELSESAPHLKKECETHIRILNGDDTAFAECDPYSPDAHRALIDDITRLSISPEADDFAVYLAGMDAIERRAEQALTRPEDREMLMRFAASCRFSRADDAQRPIAEREALFRAAQKLGIGSPQEHVNLLCQRAAYLEQAGCLQQLPAIAAQIQQIIADDPQCKWALRYDKQEIERWQRADEHVD